MMSVCVVLACVPWLGVHGYMGSLCILGLFGGMATRPRQKPGKPSERRGCQSKNFSIKKKLFPIKKTLFFNQKKTFPLSYKTRREYGRKDGRKEGRQGGRKEGRK